MSAPAARMARTDRRESDPGVGLVPRSCRSAEIPSGGTHLGQMPTTGLRRFLKLARIAAVGCRAWVRAIRRAPWLTGLIEPFELLTTSPPAGR